MNKAETESLAQKNPRPAFSICLILQALSSPCETVLYNRWARWDSNPEPRNYELPALAIELQAREEVYFNSVAISPADS